MPLVIEPASMASTSSMRKALVRCFGVSPPWQPMTRRSTGSALPGRQGGPRSAVVFVHRRVVTARRELLRHLEELQEVAQPGDVVHHDDAARLLAREAEALEPRH